MANVKELKKLKKKLIKEAARGRHNQASWIMSYDTNGEVKRHFDEEVGAQIIEIDCGTAACAAGWTVLMHGGKFVSGGTLVATPEEILDADITKWTAQVATSEDNWYSNLKDVEVVDIQARAERILGLRRDQAHLLFFRASGHDQAVQAIDMIVDEPGRDFSLFHFDADN